MTPTITRIFNAIYEVTGVTSDTIMSRDRSSRVCKARAIAAYCLQSLRHMSTPEIGAAIGGRAHNTVLLIARRGCVEADAMPVMQLLAAPVPTTPDPIPEASAPAMSRRARTVIGILNADPSCRREVLAYLRAAMTN